MPRYIFKFELDPSDGGSFKIPEGSFFLDLQVQQQQLGQPVMWWSVPARVPPDESAWLLRTFEVVPTGAPGYEGEQHYVGTFQLGGFVGHVFSPDPFPRTLDEAYAETIQRAVA